MTKNNRGDYFLDWTESTTGAVTYTAVVHDSNGLAASATICVSFLNEGDNSDGTGGFGGNNNNGSCGAGGGSAVRPLPKPQNALGLNSLFQVSVNNSGGSSEQEYELEGEAGQVFLLEVVIGAGGNATTQCQYHAPTYTAEFTANWTITTSWGAATSGGDSGTSPQDCGIKKLYIVQFPDDPDPTNRKLTFKGKIKITQYSESGAAARSLKLPTAGLAQALMAVVNADGRSAEHDCSDCEYCAVCNCPENCNCCNDCRQTTGKCCDDCNYQDYCNYSYDDYMTFLSLGVEPVDITIIEQNPPSTPNVGGLLVIKTSMLDFALSPLFVNKENTLTGQINWQYCQLRSNGEYTAKWKNFQNGNGTKFSHSFSQGGIYRIRAKAGSDIAQYVRKIEDSHTWDSKDTKKLKVGDPDAIGVCDTQKQIDIRNKAAFHLGSTYYSSDGDLPFWRDPVPLFSGTYKCNVFVADVCDEADANVGQPMFLRIYSGSPPSANRWSGMLNIPIPNFALLPNDYYPQPGFISAKLKFQREKEL